MNSLLQELDHGYRAANSPGTPAYASSAIKDLFPRPTTLLSYLPGIGDSAELADNLHQGMHPATAALLAALPFASGKAVNSLLNKIQFSADLPTTPVPGSSSAESNPLLAALYSDDPSIAANAATAIFDMPPPAPSARSRSSGILPSSLEPITLLENPTSADLNKVFNRATRMQRMDGVDPNDIQDAVRYLNYDTGPVIWDADTAIHEDVAKFLESSDNNFGKHTDKGLWSPESGFESYYYDDANPKIFDTDQRNPVPTSIYDTPGAPNDSRFIDVPGEKTYRGKMSYMGSDYQKRPTTLIKNPTKTETARLLKEQADDPALQHINPELRYARGPDGSIYVWKASDALHKDIFDYLGISDKNPGIYDSGSTDQPFDYSEPAEIFATKTFGKRDFFE